MKHRRPMRWRPDWYWRLLGAGGFIYLLLQEGSERITYMLACLALMGFPPPSILRKDKDE